MFINKNTDDEDDPPSPAPSYHVTELPSHRPDVPQKTQLEPIAIPDPADFTDPPDSQTVLGQGAFAEVSWVAYKSLLDDGDRDTIIFEGQVMQLLSNHASFAKVYGVAVREHHKALVFEFLGDELTACLLTLTDALCGERPLVITQDEWCDIALDIVEGVWYMHRCDVLHLDIKTDNILLVEGAGCWSACITNATRGSLQGVVQGKC